MSSCSPSYYNMSISLQNAIITTTPLFALRYFNTTTVPSNDTSHRTWNFTGSGYIENDIEKVYTIHINYEIPYNQCDYNVSFIDPLEGVLIINNEVFSAGKYMSFYHEQNSSLLDLLLRIPCRLRSLSREMKPLNLFFNIFISDDANTPIKIDYINPSSGKNWAYTPNTLNIFAPFTGTFTISNLTSGDFLNCYFKQNNESTLDPANITLDYPPNNSNSIQIFYSVNNPDFPSTLTTYLSYVSSVTNWMFYIDYNNTSQSSLQTESIKYYYGSTTPSLTIESIYWNGEDQIVTFSSIDVTGENAIIYLQIGNISASDKIVIEVTKIIGIGSFGSCTISVQDESSNSISVAISSACKCTLTYGNNGSSYWSYICTSGS